MEGLSPTGLRIYEFLLDGKLHSKEEIRQKCLWDELAHADAVIVQIVRMRPVLHRNGLDIANSRANGGQYRMVRLLSQE